MCVGYFQVYVLCVRFSPPKARGVLSDYFYVILFGVSLLTSTNRDEMGRHVCDKTFQMSS